MYKILFLKKESNEYNSVFIANEFMPIFIEPLHFKFINGEELTRRLASEYDGLILTSPRAIETLERVWTPEMQELWSQRPVYTVGEISAKNISKSLKLNSLGSKSGNSDILREFIIEKHGHKKKLFFPCGNLAAESNIKDLSLHGFEVDNLTVYETEENEDFKLKLEEILFRENPISSVVFFSPSGVKVFSKYKNQIHWLTNTQLFAIGKTTAKAMTEMDLHVNGVAIEPSPNSLLQCVSQCVNNHTT